MDLRDKPLPRGKIGDQRPKRRNIYDVPVEKKDEHLGPLSLYDNPNHLSEVAYLHNLQARFDRIRIQELQAREKERQAKADTLRKLLGF